MIPPRVLQTAMSAFAAAGLKAMKAQEVEGKTDAEMMKDIFDVTPDILPNVSDRFLKRGYSADDSKMLAMVCVASASTAVISMVADAEDEDKK